MQKVLSVSVAAYNVEPFITQCLDSILDPAVLERVEVLVTDDGSRDHTAEIVAEYQKKYPGTFQLISQKNAGPGSTVNSGIAHASGKYFRMVDGDDWVNTQNMGKFLNILEQTDADMVCTGFCRVDHETGRTERAAVGIPSCSSADFEDICRTAPPLSMHNVTYRTELLQRNGIHLDNGFYTDSEYLLFPIPYVKTVTVADLTIYMYRVSLSTQSMNMVSLRKNRDMHRLVLEHLTDFYAAWEDKLIAKPNTSRFLRRNIAGIAGMQLCIYLTMEDETVSKEATRQMLLNIRQKSAALYREINRAATFRLLTGSRFLLFPILASRQKKKLGENV